MKSPLILTLIILLAALLRLTYLSSVPPSLNWDEASVGWNAYSLLKTGSDEYGNRHPLTIRSFDDYKPAVYTYLLIPEVALFGLSEFSVRLPAALSGIATVAATYFFGQQLTRFGLVKSQRLPFLAALFLAVSPWHIQFSRIAFEASVALFFFIVGTAFLLAFFNQLKASCLFLAVIFFVLAFYTHHSLKLILPIFALALVTIYRDIFRRKWKETLIAGLIGVLLLLPLIRSVLRPAGQASRFATVSIFAPQNQFHNQNNPLPTLLFKNYFSHFGPGFLFAGVGDSPRHHAPNAGVLLIWSGVFIILGFIALLRNRPRAGPLLLIWFILAPLAAIFAIDTPHASRSFLYVPMYEVLAALGIITLSRWHWQSKLIGSGIITVLLVVNLLYFFRQYFWAMPKLYALYWQYGYRQLVENITLRRSHYQKIYITSAYDQPYIYFLFYGLKDPHLKNDGSFYRQIKRYHFVDFKSWTRSDWGSLNRQDLLALSAFDQIDQNWIIGEIRYPNGQVAFKLASRP